MKNKKHILFVFIIFLFSCSPKHITKQSQVTSIVTLGDYYFGTLSKSDIKSKPNFTIQNNKLNWKIISYSFTFTSKGGVKMFLLSGDTIAMDALSGTSKGTKIFIDQIRAVNKHGDTCYLNPIVIKIKE